MGQYLQWYPPNQQIVSHPNLTDGDSGTWYYVWNTLYEGQQYDTWGFTLSASSTYSFSVDNQGGYSGLWTDLIIVDSAGNHLRSNDFWGEELTDYNADVWSFSPAYSGTYYAIVYKHFPWDDGYYQMTVTDIPKYVPPPDPNAILFGTGTEGADFVTLTDRRDNYLAGGGNDTIAGMGGFDTIQGGLGSDDLNGNTGNDKVYGGAGRDFVRGGQDDDFVFGEGDDDWHVNGNQGNDLVYGDDGNDGLFGGPGFDRLYGGTGNDTLSGDLGNDSLYGDEGADLHVFGEASGQDTVYGFDGGAGDRIRIAPGLNGTGVSDFAGLAVHLTQEVGGARLDLGAGNNVFFVGTPKDAIWAGVVEFG